MNGKIRVFQTMHNGIKEIGTLECNEFGVKAGDKLTIGFMEESIALKRAPLAHFVDLRIEQITERHQDYADLVSRVAVIERHNARFLSKSRAFVGNKAFGESIE